MRGQISDLIAELEQVSVALERDEATVAAQEAAGVEVSSSRKVAIVAARNDRDTVEARFRELLSAWRDELEAGA